MEELLMDFPYVKDHPTDRNWLVVIIMNHLKSYGILLQEENIK